MRIPTEKGACGTGPATCRCALWREIRDIEEKEERNGGSLREKDGVKEREYQGVMIRVSKGMEWLRVSSPLLCE
jgi:hypothetical protein